MKISIFFLIPIMNDKELALLTFSGGLLGMLCGSYLNKFESENDYDIIELDKEEIRINLGCTISSGIIGSISAFGIGKFINWYFK